MADLELINLKPMYFDPKAGKCVERAGAITEKLPQLFWSDGRPWLAACEFGLSKLRDSNCDMKTISSSMGHLRAYASWLEASQVDWRDFPKRKRDRCLFKYRGFLIEQRDQGRLAPSTTTTRMSSVIQFYRWARAYGWIERKELWEDQTKAVRFHTTVGLARTLAVLSSELSIPNRKRSRLTLEGGLLPVENKTRNLLLQYLKKKEMIELFLMLLIGFFTGARSETIRTLRLVSIEHPKEDPSLPGVPMIAVGPGTGVKTKSGVSGDIPFPMPVLEALRDYATSPRRLFRQAKASQEDQGLLFLTERGNWYSETTLTKLISRMREQLVSEGLVQFKEFKFHQSRATYGTQLMRLAMDNLPSQTDAICFVRDAMLHADESTTWKYVKFIEQAPLREKFSGEFFNLFTGVSDSNESSFLNELVVSDDQA